MLHSLLRATCAMRIHMRVGMTFSAEDCGEDFKLEEENELMESQKLVSSRASQHSEANVNNRWAFWEHNIRSTQTHKVWCDNCGNFRNCVRVPEKDLNFLVIQANSRTHALFGHSCGTNLACFKWNAAARHITCAVGGHVYYSNYWFTRILMWAIVE